MGWRRAAAVAFVLSAVMAAAGSDFAMRQDSAPRVRKARLNAMPVVKELFERAGVTYPTTNLFIRTFKSEKQLEVWAGQKGGEMKLIKAYAVCALSGDLGPKRRQGDGQIPEGVYAIDRFNPSSNFHLSLGLDYPNASDRVLSDRRQPGGDIFIHGSCVTIGCLPLEDGPVEEVYLMALDARVAGQRRIPVHIFPSRMDEAAMGKLDEAAGSDAQLKQFWRGLAAVYRAFEATRRVPKVGVDGKGRYLLGTR